MSSIIRRTSAIVMLLGATGAIALPAQTVQANATNATTVVLNWTAVSGAERYYVQRAIGSASFSNLSTPKITGTGYTDTGVPANVLVQYRLMTKLANGNFRYSSAVQRRPPGSSAAGAPVATSGGAASQAGGAASGSAASQAGGSASQTGGSVGAAAAPAGGAASTGGTAAAGGATSHASGAAPAAGGAASPAGGAPQAGGAAPPASATLLPGQPISNVAATPRDPHRFVAVAPAAPAAAAAPAPTAAPAPAAAAVATSGRYRVVANGFSVIQQAHSHHDDVYGGFVMLHFNRQTGEIMDRDARHTKVLGDINGRVFGETDGGDFNRLRAGTANASGGLKNGDSYPDAGHARFRGQDGTPPNRMTFPFEIWTGDLTNASDAVVILPSLWSRDGKLSGFDQWQSSELSAGSQIWYDQAVQQALHQTTLGVVAPPGAVTPNGDQNFTRLATVVGAAVLGGMGNPSAWALALPLFDPSAHDFPIGFDPSAKALPRRAIVLTREMIEQALNSPPPPLSPTMLVPNYPAWILGYLQVPVGVIPVLLFDHVPPPGEPLRTSYVMYLQVERM